MKGCVQRPWTLSWTRQPTLDDGWLLSQSHRIRFRDDLRLAVLLLPRTTVCLLRAAVVEITVSVLSSRSNKTQTRQTNICPADSEDKGSLRPGPPSSWGLQLRFLTRTSGSGSLATAEEEEENRLEGKKGECLQPRPSWKDPENTARRRRVPPSRKSTQYSGSSMKNKLRRHFHV